MARVLVVGGSGDVGTAVVRAGIERGHEVHATHRSRPPSHPAATWHRVDLAGVPSLAQDMDAVVHAAPGHVADVGCRLLHMSSDLVFDGKTTRPYTEADPPCPVDDYGREKLAAEQAVVSHSDALIVRTSLVYDGAAPLRHEQAALANTMAFFTDEVRCPIQRDDLAGALLDLLPQAIQGAIHVAGSESVSRYEFARLVARNYGADPEELRGASLATSGLTRPAHVVLDSSRAAGLIGTRLRGVREVLAAEPV